jgi:multiple sugar transport system ATP-binding protein
MIAGEVGALASVTFDGVSKRFGDVVAVDHLDLAIEDGEFMVLLGPSGCGKTTALRMIAGLEDISDGAISIGDQVVNHVDPASRNVSMVFQSYALYPHMTVERNIESPLLTRKLPVEVVLPAPEPADGAEAEGSEGEAGDGVVTTIHRKLTKAERRERVDEAARVLGLDQLLKRKPAALSGGQRQRVALARAFVGRPQAFLMDEPLSNLDAKLRAQTRTELVELHRRIATTVVYVTHDQVEAITMATRVAILSDGRLQQVGTPKEVYDAPANLFVARFIGTPPTNTLSGTFTSVGGSPAIAVDESRFPVPSGLTTRLEEGRPVVVGVRPEHLVVDATGPITQKVRAVEWLGHECLVLGSIGSDEVVVRQAGMVGTDADTLGLSVDPSLVHLFDPETTDRLP